MPPGNCAPEGGFALCGTRVVVVLFDVCAAPGDAAGGDDCGVSMEYPIAKPIPTAARRTSSRPARTIVRRRARFVFACLATVKRYCGRFPATASRARSRRSTRLPDSGPSARDHTGLCGIPGAGNESSRARTGPDPRALFGAHNARLTMFTSGAHRRGAVLEQRRRARLRGGRLWWFERPHMEASTNSSMVNVLDHRPGPIRRSGRARPEATLGSL
jgi:hypothetical protein